MKATVVSFGPIAQWTDMAMLNSREKFSMFLDTYARKFMGLLQVLSM